MEKIFNSKQTGILSSSDLKTVKGQIFYWLIFIVLTVVTLVSVVPSVWTVLTAFKEAQEIYTSLSFFPKKMSMDIVIERLQESWDYLQLTDSILNTIVLSLGNLAVRIVVCGFGGYVLSKLKPRGSKLIFTLVVWTMMMPGQIRMVPNYISYLHFPFAFDFGIGVNLLDTFWPIWLSSGADTFAVLLFKNAFDALSNSYVEAAKLDGCTNYGVFFKIMLPLAMPVVIFESINVLSAAWSEFFAPLLILDQNVVVPLKIYRLQSDPNVQMNTYFMGLFFASIPPFIIFLIFQKRILGGINIGGVKG